MSSLSNGKWEAGSYRGYKSKKLGYLKIHQWLLKDFLGDSQSCNSWTFDDSQVSYQYMYL
jgi:hypothetical protein